MKKILVLFLTLILCFSITACVLPDGFPEKKDFEKETDTSEEELEALVFGLNETAAFSELAFTATEMKESSGADYFKPEEGNVFVGIHFTIENTSDEEQSVSSLLMFDGYVDDVKCDYSFNAACAFDDGTLDGDVAPGKKLVGWYAVEVPADWSTIELEVQDKYLSKQSAKFVFEK
ncbi:MAG: DUF4352 domain-containing protein [Clostridia bacterium]|nr:DUF4352 domain-containing protein [Clostridia bacterium]